MSEKMINTLETQQIRRLKQLSECSSVKITMYDARLFWLIEYGILNQNMDYSVTVQKSYFGKKWRLYHVPNFFELCSENSLVPYQVIGRTISILLLNIFR